MRIHFYHLPCFVLSLVLSCLPLNLKATSLELGAFEKMRYLYLENGMEIVLLENHNAPVIASVVIVKTGLHFEQPEINGASHYLEHLLFNGTTTRTQKQLYDDIDRIGGYNNAHTDRDYTNFILLTPKENFTRGLEIQADMLFHSTIPIDKFEKERKIILEEMAKDKSRPDYEAENYFYQFLFRDSIYGLPVLGSSASIAAISRNKIWEFYKKFYVPNNMIAVIMGDFKSGAMIDLLKKYFGQTPPGNLLYQTTGVAQLVPRTNEKATFYLENLPQNAVHLVYLAPPFDDRDYYATRIFADILQNRLQEALTNTAPPTALDVTVEYAAHRCTSYLHVAAIQMKNQKAEPAIHIVHSMIADYATNLSHDGEMEREIQRVVKKILSQDIYDAQRPHYFGMLRSQEIALGGFRYLDEYEQMLQSISPADIRSVLKKYVLDKPPAMVQIRSAGQPEPAKEEVKEQTSEQKFRLENGLMLVVKQDSSTSVFGMHILFKNRCAMEPVSQTGIAEVLHYMFEKGSINYPSDKFQEKVDELGISLKLHDWTFVPYDNYYLSSSYSYIRLECLNPTVEPAVGLVGDLLKYPILNEENLAAIKKLLTGQIMRNSRSVENLARDTYNEALLGAPYRNSIYGTQQSLEAISLTNLQEFYQRYVCGENMIVAVVSNLPAAEVKQLVTENFGNLPAGSSLERSEISVKSTTVSQKIEKEMGKEQSTILFGRLLDEFNLNDLQTLLVVNQLFADQLTFHLREEKGWAYSIGSSIEVDPSLSFQIFMGTRKENMNQAFTAIQEEFKTFGKRKLSEDEIAKAKNQILGRTLLRHLTRENQAYYLSLGEFQFQDFHFYDRLLDQLKEVTLKDVELIRNKFLARKELLSVVVK